MNISPLGLVEQTTVLLNGCKTVLRCRQPSIISHAVWKRHGFTLKDIRDTLSAFPCKYVWLTAFLYGITPSLSAINISFDDPLSIGYTCKAFAIRKIIKCIQGEFTTNDPHMELSRYQGHYPPIPMHYTTPAAVDQCKETHEKGTMAWRDITCTATEVFPDRCLMVRVVPESQYRLEWTTSEFVDGRRKIVRFGDQVSIYTDEYFWLRC